MHRAPLDEQVGFPVGQLVLGRDLLASLGAVDVLMRLIIFLLLIFIEVLKRVFVFLDQHLILVDVMVDTEADDVFA